MQPVETEAEIARSLDSAMTPLPFRGYGCPARHAIDDRPASHRPGARSGLQNMPFSCACWSGIICNTSQCSTTLPSLSNRKMSIPA